MNSRPDVSVVMSVYNGAANLRETIDSVLNQEGVSLEFIIVNDGSSDASPQILNEYAQREPRIRIIHQDNQGLTRALINGCAAAKGKYIARQDAGDRSLPRRLANQYHQINRQSNAAFISCGTRFLGPGRECLYEITVNPEDATSRLLMLSLEEIRGPSIHGCVMFSRDAYDRVGGYRPSFYFAQDLDLWIRMAELGEHLVLPEILYEASITVGAISGMYRDEQIKIAQLILESARLRRLGLGDQAILQRAQTIRPFAKRKLTRSGRARTLYFIGMCLREKNRSQARHYFKQALSICPLHFKSAVRLLVG